MAADHRWMGWIVVAAWAGATSATAVGCRADSRGTASATGTTHARAASVGQITIEDATIGDASEDSSGGGQADAGGDDSSSDASDDSSGGETCQAPFCPGDDGTGDASTDATPDATDDATADATPDGSMTLGDDASGDAGDDASAEAGDDASGEGGDDGDAEAEEPACIPMPFKYPFNNSGDVVLVPCAVINKAGDTLTITVDQGDKFETHAGQFGFFGAMDGSEPKFWDTDSAQTAVTFADATPKEVGKDTNAVSAAKARPSAANCAAKWDRTPAAGKQPNRVGWTTSVPKTAVHMEALVVYSDTLYNTPADAADKNYNGDMHMIIASWSADLKAGAWTITANAGDTFPPQAAGPTIKEIVATVAATTKLVKTKTGYAVAARPATLDGISSPADDANGAQGINDKVAAAQKAGLINPPAPRTGRLSHDTGFDVVPR
jgi:hypothetical protein